MPTDRLCQEKQSLLFYSFIKKKNTQARFFHVLVIFSMFRNFHFMHCMNE